MVAAENDGIKTPKGQEAKAGGIGDVVRDTPPALAALEDKDCRVTIVVPSYGALHKLQGAKKCCTYDFSFAGGSEQVDLYQVNGKTPDAKVRHLVLHNSRFEPPQSVSGKLPIYLDDPPGRPFASDGTKFACFCAAVAEGLKECRFDDAEFGEVNRLHLHDWHGALLLILRFFDPQLAALKQLRTVYTIHNLAFQGIRPSNGDSSSLGAWYPHLKLQDHEVRLLSDPDYANCVNPMAVGIRLSNAVHVVSPGYKPEVLRPTDPHRSDPDAIRFGGEGLEVDLLQADAGERLFGILNGCQYDDRKMPRRNDADFQELLRLLEETASHWFDNNPQPVHALARERIKKLQTSGTRPDGLLTCVTRVVNQKMRLMRMPAGKPSLEAILKGLPDNHVLILLGNGDHTLEIFLEGLSKRFDNFIFLNGFDSSAADALYANGDLFLMPSSFEPCGISQMMAMRDGQPCVVHHVGGLKDTVHDKITGFDFCGDTPHDQAENFVKCVFAALELLRSDPVRYDTIRHAAFKKRFWWRDSVQQYVKFLYQ
jgi:starch synthase